MRDMACPKLVSSGLISSKGYAYVIGGSVDQICERYDPERDIWTMMPNFKKHVGVANGLFSYAIVLAKWLLKVSYSKYLFLQINSEV